MNAIANLIRKMVLSYSYSSVQADLPTAVAQKVIDWGLQNIPDQDLASDGREDNIHVTVKYGLWTNAWDDIRNVLIHQPSFEVVLGPVSIFKNGEHDVVKLSVTSPELIRLNKLISDNFEHTDTHPDYIPHCTIAYVQPGLGVKYDGRKDFDGLRVRIDDLTFSGNDNRTTLLPLIKGQSKAAVLRKIANLVEHAHRELESVGMFDKDSDYEGMLGDAVMDLIKCFAEQGHSGFSAQMALELFSTLAQYKTLTPITDDPEEWMEVSDDLWQNKRDSRMFSKDGGKTFYNVDDKKRELNKAKKKEKCPCLAP